MKKNLIAHASLIVCLLVLQIFVFVIQPAVAAQPNIIIILADDMGWGDLCADSNVAGFKSGPACNQATYSYYCHKDPSIAGNCTDDTDCTSSNYSTKAGCYRSNANTPRLDNLAQKGVRLANFYTPAPVCSPARASLLTGRYPINHGVANAGVQYQLSSREVTIAQALKKLNYSTGMVGKWHLGWDGNYYPNERGFNYYYALPNGVFSSMYGFQLHDSNPADNISVKSFCTHPEMKSGGCPSDFIDYWCPEDSCPDNYKATLYKNGLKKSLTEIITDRAIEFIKNTESRYRITNYPFFLYVALPSPHAPLDIHLPKNEGYDLKTKSFGCCTSNPRTCGDSKDDLTTCVFKNQFEENNRPADSSLNYYSQVIHEIDTRVQEVIDAIDNMPDTNKDTIVIFTSDNGTDMGISGTSDLEGDATYVQNSTGGLRGSKRFVFEGGVRVPFIAYWKGPNSKWPARPVSGQLADHTDLFPTLLHAAGLSDLSSYYSDPNKPINGQDLMAFFTSGAPISNEVQYYSTEPNVNKALLYDPSSLPAYYAPYYAYRKYSPDNVDGLNNFKMLFDPIKNDPYCGPLKIYDNPFDPSDPKNTINTPLCRGWELYDLAGDIKERNNILNDHGPVIAYDYNDTCNVIPKPKTCRQDFVKNVKFQKFKYFLPSIKDNDAIGWQNYITVKAINNEAPMDVTYKVYDLAGGDPVGQYSVTVAPKDRSDQRPSLIKGTAERPVPVEGSVIIETSVPAIVSTNTIANTYQGFSINEAAKPRSVHFFPKAYDGPNNYQVSLLIQNIYDTPRNVTIKLKGYPCDNVVFTTDIPKFGTLKKRPSEIDGCLGKNFNGAAEVYSNAPASVGTTYSAASVIGIDGFGVGLPVPAMCRYEVGSDALAIYESTVVQPSLYFPVLKDGKFGGSLDYQNFLSVVNPGNADATVSIYLYKNKPDNEKIEDGKLLNEVIPAGGKKTWRPSQIKSLLLVDPPDFEGSAVVFSNVPVVGMTNTIYPRTVDSTTSSSIEAFDLIESSVPNSILVFPKAFDNLLAGSSHLVDNTVYVQNPDNAGKKIKIEQFNKDGTANGVKEVALGPHETYLFRPKDFTVLKPDNTSYPSDIQDASKQFQGSIRVTEITKVKGLMITGALKYEVHSGATATTYVESMTIYRSMGQ